MLQLIFDKYYICIKLNNLENYFFKVFARKKNYVIMDLTDPFV